MLACPELARARAEGRRGRGAESSPRKVRRLCDIAFASLGVHTPTRMAIDEPRNCIGAVPRLAGHHARWFSTVAAVAVCSVGCGGLAGSAGGDAGTGAETDVDTGESGAACLDAKTVAIDSKVNPTGAIALDSTDVYWIGSRVYMGPKQLLRTPKSGGRTESLAPSTGFYLALDGERAYFTDANNTALYAVPKAGGSAPLVLRCRASRSA